MNRKIHYVEEYVKGIMGNEIAHDFKHADRVRRWVLHIAQKEGFEDVEMVEIAALLHDIGRSQVKEWRKHGEMGAIMAAQFLQDNNLLTQGKRDEICNAIRYHNKNREGKGELLNLLRDADMMDLFGAVGTMRTFTSHASKPEYDPENIKGETWKMSARDFDKRFDRGIVIGSSLIDHLNFQISCYDNLSTKTARKLAKPLVKYMKEFIEQLEKEIRIRSIP